MNDPIMEREANIFAMYLLMPESLLRRDVKKMGGIDMCNDGQISLLAKRYQVSTPMMAARLWELYKVI